MGDRKGGFWYKELFPFTAMVATQCINVGVSIIFKAATLKGLDFRVFMLYSYCISALLFLPLCYFSHRKSQLPPLTIGLLGRFLFLGFLGFSGQYLGYIGIEYSNPTLASAMTNLTPASTFILAVLFRMEKLEMKSWTTQVKIIGSVITIAGALLVVLYNGPVLIRSSTSSASVLAQHPALVTIAGGTKHSDWVKGGALLAVEYVIVGLWCISQAKVIADYPAELAVVFFYNLSCLILAAPACLMGVTNSSAWNILKPDVRLYSVVYSGVMGSGFGILIQTWGVHIKGPVYIASFMPLSIAIAAIMGFIFLGDDLYLGSVIGSLIISLGFYALIWAKAKEDCEKGDEFGASSSQNAPLLGQYDDSTNEGRASAIA
ncbi:WAT1-related protein At5g40240-like isoform X1 [Coffea arabica]|uniref:WAT1-related protein n=1 Tax=Coffea arabica TaxID=13443 RepID=A0A6P6TA53_COFAR